MLEELEQQETQEQLVIPRLEIAPPAPVLVENDQKQRRRMVIALVMLLVALGLVLVKDRDFWFPTPDVADSEVVDEPAAPASDAAEPIAASPNVTTPAATPSIRKRHGAPQPVVKALEPPAPAAPAVSASRAVLPPLRVEVFGGGDQRQVVRPGSPSVKVELQNGMPGKIASEPARQSADFPDPMAMTNTGERVEMSTDTRQALTRPVRPEYPLLARQMKVQGAVVLSVFIDKDGGIENLQVVSGPAILADAARAAVKQWRFKPYLQDGVPVATQARVTVAFTMSVAN